MNRAAPTTPQPPRWRRRDWLWLVLLGAAIAAAYLPVRQAGFIWDDEAHLTANRCIVGPLGFKEIWTTAEANYFPLVLTHLWVLHAIFGLNPLVYHLVNVLLHAAGAVLLWRVLRRLGVPGAWLGAALWALHPVQVESVAWISELKNTQAAVFYLLAIRFFVAWLSAGAAETPRWRNYALALGCALLAILSKPSTVMLPVVLGLCAWWLAGRWEWRMVRPLVPFLALSAIASSWTVWEQMHHSLALGPEWSQSWAERIVISGRVVWFYLGKLLWPQPLMFIYPRWTPDAASLRWWLPALTVAAGFLGLWRFRHRWSRPWFFAFAYFVVSLFPVLGFFNVYYFRYSFVADHFQHLASIGPLALAGAGLALAARRVAHDRWLHRTGVAACGLLLLGLGVQSWRHSRTFASNTTLWQTTAARNPQCWLAINALGMESMDRGRFAESLEKFQQAFRIKPDEHTVLSNIGNALVQTGKASDAISYFQRALRVQPSFAEAHNGLGYALTLVQRPAEAIPEFEAALRINPKLWQPHFSLANALVATGRVAEAIPHYAEAARLNPESVDAFFFLGRALLQTGQSALAIQAFESVLRLRPDQLEARAGLAGVLYVTGRAAEAVAHFETVLKAKPDDPVTHNNLAGALSQTGRISEAIAHYERALQLKPDYANAHSNFGLVLAGLGRNTEAMMHFREALRLQPDHDDARRGLASLQGTPADGVK